MNIGDVDLNLLHAFDAVLRERSVTGAAQRLRLSQPAVSNALARLRRLFGDALFVRTPAGMRPTPFAQTLAEPVREALALLETALAQGAGFDPATSKRAFRVHLSDIGEMVFLPPLVERVRAAAPGVRLEATQAPVREIAEALATGVLDLAVGFLPGIAAPVRTRLLFRDPYVCMMRTGHGSIGRTLSRRQFEQASHALVSSEFSGHRVVEEALEREGLMHRVALRVPHFTVVPMVLERTDLLVTIPRRIARTYEREGKLKSLRAPIAIPFAEVGVHWHERFERDPGNTWLREQFLALFAE